MIIVPKPGETLEEFEARRARAAKLTGVPLVKMKLLSETAGEDLSHYAIKQEPKNG